MNNEDRRDLMVAATKLDEAATDIRADLGPAAVDLTKPTPGSGRVRDEDEGRAEP